MCTLSFGLLVLLCARRGAQVLLTAHVQRMPASAFNVVASMPGTDASLPPLGRLDMDSRGLLLLSEDGVVAKAVIGPASELDKEYLVTVVGAAMKS